MTRKLDSIPYDVFYQIASSLDCDDFVNLSRVNRALHSLMREDSIARKTIESNLLHTKEGQEAYRAKSGYRRAVGHLFDIKEAFATAQPYSASVLAYGTAFLYKHGSLCYIHNNEIRALNVHSVDRVEQVLNIPKVISRAIPGCDPLRYTIRVSLLNYSDGILAFLVEMGEGLEAWLLAVDMRRKTDGRSGRLRLRAPLRSTRRLFVRHNKSYLYYGAQSALSHHGYPQWAIHCVDLATGRHVTDKPVELEKLVGNEIGQTVCFEVYQDHLYAVSTLVDFEEEEVDWTSLYMYTCIAPRRNPGIVKLADEWRRQHREGPINESWSDLSLRVDEATNQLMILECRREWRNGGSDNCRTYYMTPLPSPAEFPRSKRPEHRPSHSSMAVKLPDDPLTKTLDSSDKPIYQQGRKRLRRYYHSEYPLDRDDDGHSSNSSNSSNSSGGNSSGNSPGIYTPQQHPRHDFILAKTKFRTYNLSASSFVDLVTDSQPSRQGSHITHDRLRLRTVSRKRKSPIDDSSNMLYPPDLHDEEGSLLEHSEERFATRGVRMWPPDDAPAELTRLLCPSTRVGKIHASADERSLVYAVNQDGLSSGVQAIVLINFDPTIRHPGLRCLADKTDDIEPLQLCPPPQVGDSPQERQAVPSVREEPAMYLSINHGYWLR
ncbi:F-box domain protein [Aspergillus clavatus NRRL 1]|uniref:F-box domain protein n=1 Tax=Aspergillus clavatus (strain ATCC 1007 / CBS 513.65 / DSM 816 / NCTC 3887 / NRRL 1 / QM 1276 / 107) TaxID=344612 RepID=A1CL81_ASPCL|nr:F-box domain protein [Aspergillus clavatus NRRL 1]EAW09905.1 F-box domain protein [Aspergillus clavatus NRRL 1]